MKTKSLLLSGVLLLLLPLLSLTVFAQEIKQLESKVKISDLPQGLKPEQLAPVITFIDKNGVYGDAGQSMISDFNFNEEDPADYTALQIKLANCQTLPDLDKGYRLVITFDLREESSLYIKDDADPWVEKVMLKKGKRSYQAELRSDNSGPHEIAIPIRGEIELNQENQTLTLDMKDFCIIPFTIQNQKGEKIPVLNFMLGDDAQTLDYLEVTELSRMILPKGTYDFTFATGGYAPMEKKLTVNGNMEKQVWTMTEADCYPLIIYPYTELGKDPVSTVTVKNVGSYQTDGDYIIGEDFKPFMAVPTGNYEVTVTASGYKTIQKTITVSKDVYDESEGAVWYEMVLTPEGTGIEDTAAEELKPEVTVSNSSITLSFPSEMKVSVYNMQGMMLYQGAGTKVITPQLTTGIYIIRIQTQQGMQAVKVHIGK